MALKPKVQAKQNMPKQPNIDPGTYPARVVQIIDLGLQPKKPYQGQEKPPSYDLYFTYELLDEFCVDDEGNYLEDKPRWISEQFALRSLAADLATSTKRYNALDPEGVHDGDFGALLGAPCNVNIVNNKSGDRVYDNIASVAGMRAKDARNAPELKNEPKLFSLDEPDLEVFRSLPQWLQDKIKSNLEYDGSALQKALEGPQKPAKAKPKADPQPEPEDAVEEQEEGFDDDAPW